MENSYIVTQNNKVGFAWCLAYDATIFQMWDVGKEEIVSKTLRKVYGFIPRENFLWIDVPDILHWDVAIMQMSAVKHHVPELEIHFGQ